MTSRAPRRRVLAIALLVLVLLAAVVMAALWWALDSALLRAQAEARLSALLGQPVAIGELRVSLVPRPALVGSQIRVGEETRAAPALDLDSVRIVPQLGSLFTRGVVVEDVVLDGFSVAVLRDREGQWHAPVALPVDELPPEADPAFVVQRIHVRDGRLDIFDPGPTGELRRTTGIAALEARLRSENGATRLTAMTGRVGEARLIGEAQLESGTARFDVQIEDLRDEDLSALLALGGTERPAPLGLPAAASATLSMRLDRGTGRLSGTGVLDAPAVRLDTLRLEGLKAPLTIEGSRFSLAPTTFTVYGGTHRGTIAVDTTGSPARWSVDSRIEALDVHRFLDALTGGDQRLQGRGLVVATLRGRAGEPIGRTLQGQARVTVAEGVVRDFPLLATLNRGLRLADTDERDTRFERLSATLAIGGGQASTDNLLLEAADVRVPASGRIGLTGALDLSGRVIFSERRSAEMIRSVRELTGLRNQRGEVEVPVTISGTIDDPSFAFDLQAMLGKAIEDELRRRIQRLIRPPG
jgi:uncharacterized protein involved in outer membrane biogenesis